MSIVRPDIKAEVKGRGSSTFTKKNVKDRLEHLKTLPPSDETDREIRFLQKLLFKG